MSGWVKHLMAAKGKREFEKFQRLCRDPRTQQLALLKKILQVNAETEYGKIHQFSRLKSPADFAAGIPVQGYESYRPYVEKMMEGRSRILTREKPLFFNLTSGTTGQVKAIPITQTTHSMNSRIMALWIYKNLQSNPKLLDHKSAAFISLATEYLTPSGIPCGNASGQTYKQLPWFVKQTYALPYELAHIADYDRRYTLMARILLESDISNLATPNPSTIIKILQKIREHGEAFVKGLTEGSMGPDLNSLGDLPRKLNLKPFFRPQPRQAKILEKILADRRPFADLWPHLSVICCWMGGSVGHSINIMKGLMGEHIPLRDLGFLASEGRFTIPMENQTPDGVLALPTNFYEFIREDEIDSPSPRFYLCDELEKGRTYYIIFTSFSGLYRYQIHDIVQVTGHFHQTPILRFLRKGKDMANITGEKMHVNHFLKAIEELEQKFSLGIKQFLINPHIQKNRYEIFMECSSRAEEIPEKSLLQVLEDSLQGQNPEYLQKRKGERLGPVAVHLMEEGWAEQIFQNELSLGKKDIQYKWKHFTTDRNDDVHRLSLQKIKRILEN